MLVLIHELLRDVDIPKQRRVLDLIQRTGLLVLACLLKVRAFTGAVEGDFALLSATLRADAPVDRGTKALFFALIADDAGQWFGNPLSALWHSPAARGWVARRRSDLREHCGNLPRDLSPPTSIGKLENEAQIPVWRLLVVNHEFRIARVQKSLRWFEEDLALLNMRVKELSAERQASAKRFAAAVISQARAELQKLLSERQVDQHDVDEAPCEPAD